MSLRLLALHQIPKSKVGSFHCAGKRFSSNILLTQKTKILIRSEIPENQDIK